MQLLIGTKNPGKIIEISEALRGLDIACVAPHDLGIMDDPEETGVTFEENAVAKARYYRDRANLPTLADDSGIIVEALKHELGIHTRRWGAGPKASDEEWIAYFLDRMKGEQNRRARFVCVLALIDEQGGAHVFEGCCEGSITATLESKYLPGLPISACFRPDGFNHVFSAISIEQKNSTSHRGRAVRQLREYLMKHDLAE